MNNFWLKLKIWTKLAVVVLAVLYVLLFVWNNKDYTAELWLFFGSGSVVKPPVLQLVLGAFALGVMVTLLARTTMRTLSQIKELKARKAIEQQEKEIEQLKAKAVKLKLKPHGEAAVGEKPVSEV